MNNRTQFTSINNSTSKSLDVKSGVPQGSILGALLFYIFFNGMHLVTEYADIYHFADNISLLYGHKSVKKTNQIINKISLNSSKTEIIIFKSKKKKITKNLNFQD